MAIIMPKFSIKFLFFVFGTLYYSSSLFGMSPTLTFCRTTNIFLIPNIFPSTIPYRFVQVLYLFIFFVRWKTLSLLKIYFLSVVLCASFTKTKYWIVIQHAVAHKHMHSKHARNDTEWNKIDGIETTAYKCLQFALVWKRKKNRKWKRNFSLVDGFICANVACDYDWV